MPISITCTNPECNQPCMVPENHAGRLVRCPNCPALIQVPLHSSVQPPPHPDAGAGPVDPFLFQRSEAAAFPASDPGGPPPPPVEPQIGEVGAIIAAFFQRCQLSKANLVVLACSLGCYILLLLAIMFPWQNLRSPSLDQEYSRLGIATLSGALSLVLTLTVLFLMGVAVLLRSTKLFEVALWCFPVWAALSTLWRVIDMVTFHGNDGLLRRSAAFGVYFVLILSLGALGTSLTVAISRFSKYKR